VKTGLCGCGGLQEAARKRRVFLIGRRGEDCPEEGGKPHPGLARAKEERREKREGKDLIEVIAKSTNNRGRGTTKRSTVEASSR